MENFVGKVQFFFSTDSKKYFQNKQLTYFHLCFRVMSGVDICMIHYVLANTHASIKLKRVGFVTLKAPTCISRYHKMSEMSENESIFVVARYRAEYSFFNFISMKAPLHVLKVGRN